MITREESVPMERFAAEGWVPATAVLDADHVLAAVRAVEAIEREGGAVAGRRGGVRHALARSAALREVALAPAAEVARRLAGGEPRLVRAILFDKTPGSNWLVPWHQDTTIAVAERPAAGAEPEGFGPWSVKDGVVHVRPPAWVLESMVTVRVHLDACGAENGPLRVIPGSHRGGLLGAAEIAERAARGPEAECVCDAGDAVVMRPLLLHASSKARSPGRRRVLHLEFATRPLPAGLRFAAA